MEQHKGDVVLIVVAVAIVLVGIWGIDVVMVRSSNVDAQRTDCQTAGFITLVDVGDVGVCVGVQGGEYVAVPLDDVRSRLEER